MNNEAMQHKNQTVYYRNNTKKVFVKHKPAFSSLISNLFSNQSYSISSHKTKSLGTKQTDDEIIDWKLIDQLISNNYCLHLIYHLILRTCIKTSPRIVIVRNDR